MKYKKCPICDEKLRNGICPVCGYDFKRLEKKEVQQDRHWDVLEQDSRTKKPVFAHEEKKCGKKKKSSKRTNSYKRQDSYKRKTGRKSTGGNRKTGLILLVVIILLASGLLPALGSMVFQGVSDIKNEIQYRLFDKASSDETGEADPYKNTTYALDTEGEYFDTELTAGEYLAGVDLPEGIYKVSIQEGKTALLVRNQKQSINIYDFYRSDAEKDDDFYKKSEEIRLYRGTYLRIDGAGTMRFETDSAKDGYELTANSLKENVAVKGTMTAGKDFPAGSYDIVCKKNRGTVQTVYQITKDGAEYTTDYNMIASGGNDVWGDPERYLQVYFYKGMKIKVPDDMEVELEPSVYTRPEHAEEYRFYEQLNGN